MKNKFIIQLALVACAVALETAALATVSQTVADDFDLMIANNCSYNGASCVWGISANRYVWQGTQEPCSCAWTMKNLDNELFFSLDNIKPGDRGESIVGLRVAAHDSWICAQIDNVQNFENGCAAPEEQEENPDSCGNPGLGFGELQDYLKVSVWQDSNCNNVFDNGEKVLQNNLQFKDGVWPIADSVTAQNPLAANVTHCLGIGWTLPASVGNIIQTDSLSGDLTFTAVSSQDNENYICGGDH